jgi:hypothetical protein
MMTGKDKCEMLKKLREKIAAENNIDGFEYKECQYQGPCEGTCPACDEETMLLAKKLQEARQKKMVESQNSMDLLNQDDGQLLMGEIEHTYEDIDSSKDKNLQKDSASVEYPKRLSGKVRFGSIMNIQDDANNKTDPKKEPRGIFKKNNNS